MRRFLLFAQGFWLPGRGLRLFLRASGDVGKHHTTKAKKPLGHFNLSMLCHHADVGGGSPDCLGTGENEHLQAALIP